MKKIKATLSLIIYKKIEAKLLSLKYIKEMAGIGLNMMAGFNEA